MRFSKYILSLSFIIAILFLSGSVSAQLNNCNAFLKGNYVEVGVNINGAFGSSEPAPAGYHPRGGVSMQNTCTGGCSLTQGLGWVSDPNRDGWTVGTPAYFGDYFLPGSPQEGWSLQVNGVQSNAWNQGAGCGGSPVLFTGSLSGINTGYSFDGVKNKAVWEGINGDSITIRQVTSLDTGNLFFSISVTLTNTSAFRRNKVYYMRTVDPDQEVATNGNYRTINNIFYQLPNALNATLVTATGITYLDAFLGLGTLDCRAKCFYCTSGLTPSVNCDSLYWQGRSTARYSGFDTADAGIGIVFNLGDINPGDSVSFAYAYILNTSDLTKAFEATRPNWTATGDTSTTPHVEGDTANVCVSTVTTVTITNPGDYTWTWYSLSGEALSTYVGPSTQVTTDTSIISLMVVGTGSCSGLPDTLILNLKPSTPLPNTPTAGSNSPVCEGSAINFTASTTTPFSSFSWTGPAGFTSPLDNPTIASSTLASAGVYTVYALKAGCFSDSAATVTVVVNPLPAPITGTNHVCIGGGSTLSSATPSGVWSSINTGVATIGSGTGAVASVSVGTTIISYTLPTTGCAATITYSVDPYPAAIGGVSPVCVASTITLTDATAGGTWASTRVAVATIGSLTGLVTGVSAGTTIITYMMPTGCAAVATVTVNPLPAAITGTFQVCQGLTTTLTGGTPGAVWSSTNTGVATIGSTTGLVTGVSAGTTVISYALATGCNRTVTFTVNPVPAAIGGVSPVCVGSSLILTNTTPGGTWISSQTGVATVGSLSGVVSGVSQGTSIITYRLATGCLAVATETVNPLPAAITGSTNVCVGIPSTFTDATPGGRWASGNTAVATIGSLTGIVSGVSPGTATISYILNTGCFTVFNILVNSSPAPITGTTSVCVGNSTTLSDITSGGTWSSSNTGIATIGSTTGVVNGVAAGTAIITYTFTAGCTASTTVTVNANPAAITPSTPVGLCIGGTATLSDPSPGGTWSSGNTGIATVGSLSGIVTGVTTGPVDITYTNAAGCFAVKTVTVNITPVAISPLTSGICQGATTTLTDGVAGGVWTSSNSGIASIGSTTGVVNGVAAGSATITYAIAACFTVATVTVNANPAAINPPGAVSVCTGFTTTLTDASPGGVWTSSDNSFATIGSTTGIVTGVSVGVVTISYTNAAGCPAFKTVTVNPTPVAITPSGSAVCVGAITTVTDATPGGNWTSANTGIATAGLTTGIITGVSAGSTTITYSFGSCFAVATVTVNANPAAITPGTPVGICVGATTTLTDASPGGTWSTANPAIATIGSTTGIVSGVAPGAVNISYTNASGCSAVKTITVNVTPVAIVPGAVQVCSTNSTTLTNLTAGGIWSSANTVIATVGSLTGVVTGGAVGTVTITYAINACYSVATVTVNPLPAAGIVSGAAPVCVGSSLTLSDAAPGGFWSSGNTAIAVVGSTTGVVTGTGAGTVNISYSVTNSCGTAVAFATVTVVPSGVAAISGTALLCAGTSSLYTNATSGGVWSVTNARATITTGGLLSGVSTGLDTIVYTVTNACGTAVATKTVNIGAFLTAGTILGVSSVCEGATITLTNGAPGGVWSATNANATVVGGLVRGITAGIDTIQYTVTSACGSATASKTITINAAPNAGVISLPTPICAGNTYTVTSTVSGGVWSVTNPRATITSLGLLTTVSPGMDTIRYAVTNGCGTATATQTVNIGAFLTAGTISGPSSVCAGSTITLTDPAPGGVWSSGNIAIATVGTTGVVRGVAGGVDTISYTVTGTCGVLSAVKTVTVIALPDAGAIAGPATVCIGSPVTFTNAAPGGLWTISNSRATITSGGLVTPLINGLDTITYTVTNSCGIARTSSIITIGTAPTVSAITGVAALCAGATATFTNTSPGGIWTSSNSTATVGSVSGIVTGIARGLDTITYNITNGCGVAIAATTVMINPLPDAGAISGPGSMCIGFPILFTDAAPGGVWSLANGTAVVSGGGMVTPLTVGTNTISYTVSNTCGVASSTQVIFIGTGTSVGAIAGPSSVCVGGTATLTNPVVGGAWSRSNARASITSAGVVTGVTPGIDTIYYIVTSACGVATASTTISVQLTPDAGVITGPSSICSGPTILYTNSVTGGVWSVTNPLATIATDGTVTGITPGVDTIVYTITNSCGTASTYKPVTIGAFLSAGSITGASGACSGSSFTLTDAVSGGIWTSSAPAIATVGSTTGIVTGSGAGTATISYTVFASCGSASATKTVTINNFPAPGIISGPSGVCTGSIILLSNATPGGTWSASNANASVTTAGVVTGLIPGLDTISYTVSNFCGSAAATKIISVNALPSVSPVAGAASVCIGGATTFTDATIGGIWTSSNTLVATVGSVSGVANGVNAGTATISYTIGNGCGFTSATAVITVNPLPTAGFITGPAAVCFTSSITLSSTTGGGTWTSSAPSIATVGSSSGLVTGVSPGAAVMTYAVTNSCGTAITTKTITVNVFPTVGTTIGASSVCVGSSTTFTNPSSGGLWTSSNGRATVGSVSGLVTGITTGSAIISFTIANACGSISDVKPITVNPLPIVGPITGADSVCIGDTIMLANSIPGGVWSAGNTNVSVSGAGVVTGLITGTSPITYTVSNSCGAAVAVKVVGINSLPYAGVITGSSNVCVGSGITLINTTPGGRWLASNSNAIIVGPGIVHGVTIGIDSIFYAVTNSCGTAVANKIISINPLPVTSPIVGISSHCIGTSHTLTNAIAGGVWTTSNPAVATVDLTSGIVTGLSSGTATITYTITNSFGCPASVSITDTVLSVPVVPAIMGSATVCEGSTTTLANALAGGVWSSSNPTVAAIDPATGSVSGLTTGSVIIRYTVTNPCGSYFAVHALAVSPLPAVAAISGASHVCAGSSTMLTNTTTGGRWSSSNTAVATVGTSSGLLTGVTPGSATITYSVTSAFGCNTIVTQTDTVNALPVVGAISGVTHQCVGESTTLTNTVSGGYWSSGDTSIAIVDRAAGIVTGVSAGELFIAYVVTNSLGCSAIAIALDTVHALPAPAPITGPANVCMGATVTFRDSVGGGVWSSSAPTIADVEPGTGIVSGLGLGTATITYTITSSVGCVGAVTAVITVRDLPTVAPVTGSPNVCLGASTTLSNATPGGIWVSVDTNIATIGSTSGVVIGRTAGTTMVFYIYTDGFGCSSLAGASETVNPLPVVAAITGVTHECMGATTTLASATPGGVWSSSNILIATVGSGSGIVTGVMPGVATIVYTVTDTLGCSGAAAVNDTVHTLPAAVPITGGLNVCVASFTPLVNTTPGGVWSSVDPAIATIHPITGVATGIAAGTATIYYTVSNACGTTVDTAVVIVNPLPSAGSISATSSSLCVGNTVTVTATAPGGIWSSSNNAIATVDSAGIVTAVSGGLVAIRYTVFNSFGCSRTIAINMMIGTSLATADVTPSGVQKLCNGALVMSVTTAGTGITYQWSWNGAPIIGATNVTYTAVNTGVYTVRISNGICSRALSSTTVTPGPDAVISFTPPNVLSTGSFATYQWFLNGVAISGEDSSSIHATVGGSYTVRVADSTGCADTANAYIFNGGTGAGVGSISLSDINVYPNPASTYIRVDAPVKVNVRMLSVDGKVVVSQNDAGSINIGGLANGMYMIMVYDQQNLLLKTVKFAKSE